MDDHKLGDHGPDGRFVEGNSAVRSTYEPRFAAMATVMCERGATDFDLARAFGVTRQTIVNWRVAHDDFADACKIGKAVADDAVERALYDRAVGYRFESEKVFQSDGQILRAETVEHVPPDVKAAIHWLKNRRPEQWRDKIDMSAHVEHEFGDVSSGDLARALLAIVGEAEHE